MASDKGQKAETVAFISDADGEFQTFREFSTEFQCSVVPVVGLTESRVSGLGTAFLVAHTDDGAGIYVTARHVLDDFREIVPGGIRPAIVLPTKTGNIRITAPIAAIGVGMEPTDVGVIGVNLREVADRVSSDFPRFQISLAEPQAGDEFMAAGYSGLSTAINLAGSLQFDCPLHFSKGSVLEVHHSHRDTAMIRFPSARTDAHFESGMSGGPVISGDGDVIGVVSSCLPGEAGLVKSTSYFALIPMIAHAVLRLPFGKVFPVWKYLQNGELIADKRFGVTIERDEIGMWVIHYSTARSGERDKG
ncbi:MAG: S1 family peptidase [Solirubrobacterales bacterium]